MKSREKPRGKTRNSTKLTNKGGFHSTPTWMTHSVQRDSSSSPVMREYIFHSLVPSHHRVTNQSH
jgi:hypothetical protein